MFEDAFDDLGIVDEGDDAYRGTAVYALERIEFVGFLNRPGPGGLTSSVRRRFVDDDGCRRVMLLFGEPFGRRASGWSSNHNSLYVLAESADRIAKERAMRRRQLKWLWKRLKQLSTMRRLTRESLLMKLGAAQSKAPAAWRPVSVEMAVQGASFGFWLNRRKLRKVRRREGRYLLRTNLTESDPAKRWDDYLQLVAVEEAFKTLQGDRSIRPIVHREEKRIEAHIFIAFLAYCLHMRRLPLRLEPT